MSSMTSWSPVWLTEHQAPYRVHLSRFMDSVHPQLPAVQQVAVYQLGQAGADKLAVMGRCGGCSSPAGQCSCQPAVLQGGHNPQQQLLLRLLLLDSLYGHTLGSARPPLAVHLS